MKTLGLLAIVLTFGLLLSCTSFAQAKPAPPAPAYLVVEGPAGDGISGLCLVDRDFRRLTSIRLGGRVEFAISPSRENIAAAWMDLEGRKFLQVFHTRDLSATSAKSSIADYATTTIGFWNPMLWMGESALVVEFVTTPRPMPDEGFDHFYAQVFRLPRDASQPIALRPDHPERIALPPDNTHIVGISDGNAVVLNETCLVRSVNLETGAAGPAIEIRPKGQNGILQSPMGWCLENDSTLALFGFDGSVTEIELRPELKIARTTSLPGLPAGTHVSIGAVEKDPFRADRVLIGTEYLHKPGSIEVRAQPGWTLIQSKDRTLGGRFAAGKDGAIVTWSDADPATIRVVAPTGNAEFKLDAAVGAIIALE